jgi:APA family basic amino acid/polyamine antiporter
VLAMILVGIGLQLFLLTMAINRQLGIRDAGITDPTHLGSAPD